MPFPLTEIVRRARNPRRSSITLRAIRPTGVQATNLYRAGYAEIIAVWTEASERIAAEYARTLAALQTDSAADIGQILTQTDGVLTRLFMLLRASFQRVADDYERTHRGKWRGAVLSATTFDIGTLLGPEPARETIATFVERNVGLARSVSDDARRRIETAVFEGVNQRRAARDVAKEISDATGIVRRRALNIAADQMTKLSSALDDERRREAGLDVWEWMHSAKRHPREEHLARNHKLFSEAERYVGRVIDGKRVRAAPAANDLPGRPPFCGCTTRAVLVFD